jgi:rhodanese-related sulfurtransferase
LGIAVADWVFFRPLRLGLVAVLGALSACWTQGVIPKEPPAGPHSVADRGKRDACESDNECIGDLVCDEGDCIEWHKMSGPVPEVSKEELASMIEAGEVQVLDVRTKAEFAMGHIEGAKNIPIAKLDDQIDALGFDKELPVVSICLTAHRSIAATRLLQRHGYKASQLRGGWVRVKKGDFEKGRGKDR